MNTSEPTIGIDFGTSTSSMAWFNPATQRAEIIKNAEGREQTPSVVYFGEGEPVVGDSALLMLEDQEECKRVILSAKRELANDSILPVPGRRLKALDVAAAILKKLKTDAERFHFHEPVKRAVITCPAAFDSLERERVYKAGILAGFEEVTLIEEPVAAALAYAREGLQVGKYILVYDLGGGTFDLAVLKQEDGAFRLAFEPRGIRRCGGDDFDSALYDHCDALVQERLGRPFGLSGLDQHVLYQCRRIKESLTSLAQSALSVYLDGVQFKEVIKRDSFEALIKERIETTVRLSKEVLATAQQRGQAVDTVVLIGGSSRIPLILGQLRDALPLSPQEWQHQDVAVALGAAYYSIPQPVPKPIPAKDVRVEPLPKTEVSREASRAQHENLKLPEDPIPNVADSIPATVTLHRNWHFNGGGVSYNFYIDGEMVLKIANGKTVSCKVTAGRHLLELRPPLDWFDVGKHIGFVFKPGQNAIFECGCNATMWKSGFYFKLLDTENI